MGSYTFLKILTIILPVGVSLVKSSFSPEQYIFAGLNETCTSDVDCTPRNSFCPEAFPPGSEQKCRCLFDHIPYTSRDENCDSGHREAIVSCLPIANNLNEKCGADLQCQEGSLGQWSYCSDDGTCQCFPNTTYSQNHKTCLTLAQNLGDACDEDHLGTQCQNIPYASCMDGHCQCDKDRIPSPDQMNICILLAKQIGDGCVDNEIQCDSLTGALCDSRDYTCQCDAVTSIPDDSRRRCLPMVAALYQECTASAQCLVANSICSGNVSPEYRTCQCASGFLESMGIPNTCIPIQNLAGYCTENIQCTTNLGKFSECRENQCQCMADGFIHNQQCYPHVSMGDICLVDEQCIADSTVIPKDLQLSCNLDTSAKEETILRCGCPRGTHNEIEGRCYQKSGYGLPCESDAQCMAGLDPGDLLVCLGETKTCGCPSNFMVNSDGSKCILESVVLDESCTESRQCYQYSDYSFCNYESHTCACLPDYDYGGEFCGEHGPTQGTYKFLLT